MTYGDFVEDTHYIVNDAGTERHCVCTGISSDELEPGDQYASICAVLTNTEKVDGVEQEFVYIGFRNEEIDWVWPVDNQPMK